MKTEIMEKALNESFNQMRPHCVKLIQEQSLEALGEFHEKLLRIDKLALQDLSPYLLFPFRVLLKKTKMPKEELVIAVAKNLAHIFSYTTLNEWSVASEFIMLFCTIITDPTDKTFQARGSEELKQSVITVLGTLFKHTCFPIWQSLYTSSNVPLLGHIVTLLLSVIKLNLAKDLRLAACNALKSLCHPEYLSLVEGSKKNLLIVSTGDTIACLLPGIATCLAKVITNDQTAGHRVKSACLKLLSTAIVVTLSDKNIELSRELKNENRKVEEKIASLLVKRDEKWVVSVAEKLGPVITNASSASNSDDWSVRLSCANFCGEILIECSETLKSCANILLKVPVKLLNDEFKQVSERCSEILEKFSSKLTREDSGSKILVEILEENLFVLCSDLPRLMRRASDEEKLSTLKIFSGYLTLLKQKINNLLYSQPHLKKLSSSLLHCLELDTSGIYFLEQVPGGDSAEDAELIFTWTFRKQFCHFHDDHIYNVLRLICNTLGQYGDLELLVDHFGDVFSNSETNCKQAVLILNEILLGSKRTFGGSTPAFQQPGLTSSVSTLLKEYVSPENWYLVTSHDSDYLHTHHQNRAQKYADSLSLVTATSSNFLSYQELSQKALKSNILLSCLQLEALLTFSRVLEDNFCTFLMDALYPVLEKSMDLNGTVSTCALHVLKGIAVNCKYANAAEMIADNADYLISTISVQLMHPDLFPRCPAVLQSMLDHSNSDMLVIISDTVDEILNALDLQHLDPGKLLIFLPVLLSVVKAVKRWFSGPSSSEEENNKPTKDEPNYQKRGEDKERSDTEFVTELRNYLLQFQRNKRIAALEEEPEVDPNWEPKENEVPEGEEDTTPEGQEEKKEVPLELKVTSKVLTRCTHLMPHADPRVRMKVMDIIAMGVEVLKRHENELLPMSHSLWSPLVARFADKELQVVMKAFGTLCVMADCSKDFLRKRFCKEMLPRILSVLRSQASHSARIGARPRSGVDVQVPGKNFKTTTNPDSLAYFQSVAFKLQQTALLGLGPLLVSINIGRKDHWSVCQSCSVYLDSKQPRQLQDATLDLFSHLIDIDEDATWLFLTGLWCPNSIVQPPQELIGHALGQGFKTVHLGGSSDPSSDYAVNVKKLLELCNR